MCFSGGFKQRVLSFESIQRVHGEYENPFFSPIHLLSKTKKRNFPWNCCIKKLNVLPTEL